MKKVRQYRMAGADPYTIHEIFTMSEMINHVMHLFRPWEVHRLDEISVVHFLN